MPDGAWEHLECLQIGILVMKRPRFECGRRLARAAGWPGAPDRLTAPPARPRTTSAARPASRWYAGGTERFRAARTPRGSARSTSGRRRAGVASAMRGRRLVRRSASVRPIRTLARHSGSVRKRSITPLWRSLHMPTAVPIEAVVRCHTRSLYRTRAIDSSISWRYIRRFAGSQPSVTIPYRWPST